MNVKPMSWSGGLLGQAAVVPEPVSITVVLCDDAKEFVLGLAKALDRAPGLTVVGVATSGEEVEHLVRRSLPDVVLMGRRLSGTDGITATRRVRAVAPTTRVAVLALSDNHGDVYKALRAGASGYLNRQMSVAEMAMAIRSVGRGECVIPAHLASAVLHDLEAAGAITLAEAEREILAGLARGASNGQLSEDLHLSGEALFRRVDDIYSKLHLAGQLDELARDRAACLTTTEVPSGGL